MPADTRLTLEDAAHLLRRAGFGPIKEEAKAFEGRRRSSAVGKLIPKKSKGSRGPANKKNRREDLEKLQIWWLRRMSNRKSRLVEKTVLFWHDHFPSSFDVIRDLPELSYQNATFREFGLGSFWELVYQVTRDPAMLDYLDGRRNRAEAPNENYARELMELFTLGPLDVNGVENYTQQDVVELARALTGFRVESKGAKRLVQVQGWAFDAGDKTLFEGMPFEMRGNLGVEGEDGIPFPPDRNVIDALFAHRDSDGRPTLARFIARKLWEWFAYPEPDLGLVDELADVFVGSGYTIGDLLFAILTHDEFYSARARESTTKNPVDFVLQTMLALDVKSNLKELPRQLRIMGMELFNPPGVNGWNHGEAWVSTSRYLERLRFAQRVAAGRKGKDGYRFRPEKRVDRRAASGAEIVDSLLARLSVALPPASRQVLIDYVGSPDRQDESWLEVKLRGLFVLLLSLPEFQVH